MWEKRRAWAAGLVLAACQDGSSHTSASAPSARSRTAAPTTSAAPSTPPGDPVHVSTFETDGRTYGVGMPIIVYFSDKITDASASRKAATVTVDGQKADGDSYFEHSQRDDAALEAHFRLQQYWPAHAGIHLDLPLERKSAGTGPTFGNSLTPTLEVSLGEAETPTYLGTAVVMATSHPEEMTSDPGETPAYDIEVPWSVRVTNSGEFIHDASWNGSIGSANLAHGCTNLNPADAGFCGFAQFGDPVTWTNTGTGTVIPVEDGRGDRNLDRATYSQGGLVPTGGN